jgi:hypothetical protein
MSLETRCINTAEQTRCNGVIGYVLLKLFTNVVWPSPACSNACFEAVRASLATSDVWAMLIRRWEGRLLGTNESRYIKVREPSVLRVNRLSNLLDLVELAAEVIQLALKSKCKRWILVLRSQHEQANMYKPSLLGKKNGCWLERVLSKVVGDRDPTDIEERELQ